MKHYNVRAKEIELKTSWPLAYIITTACIILNLIRRIIILNN